jgi:hypothetical protein
MSQDQHLLPSSLPPDDVIACEHFLHSFRKRDAKAAEIAAAVPGASVALVGPDVPVPEAPAPGEPPAEDPFETFPAAIANEFLAMDARPKCGSKARWHLLSSAERPQHASEVIRVGGSSHSGASHGGHSEWFGGGNIRRARAGRVDRRVDQAPSQLPPSQRS